MIEPGAIYSADFEDAGPHPVIVVSRPAFNRGRYAVVVARHARGLSGATDTDPQQAGCAVVNVLNDDNPYSFHPGGVSAVMGDGAVTFMAESIDATVFANLISRDGGDAAATP